MRIVRRADHRRMAWKNGRGLTEEVAVSPPGSTVEDFDWRLSIAHVDADGPFSLLPGVDRTIALLDGPGLVLDLPAGRSVALAPGGAPFSFAGEWPISSRTRGGPTIDLNAMTRRGRCTHRMERLMLDAGARFAAAAPGWAVFAAASRLAAGGNAVRIDRFDALRLDPGEAFECGESVAALWVTIAMA